MPQGHPCPPRRSLTFSVLPVTVSWLHLLKERHNPGNQQENEQNAFAGTHFLLEQKVRIHASEHLSVAVLDVSFPFPVTFIG